MIIEVLSWTWYYLKESSPWLLLGFLLAGLLKAFIPSEAILNYLGKRDFKSVLRASIVGIPLPLCSCGVLPTGIGLYEQGASKASTLAFIIATPATTITSILLILGMIGWKFMLAQIATAFGVALLTGLLAFVFLKDEERVAGLPKEKVHRLHKGFMGCEECKRNLKARIKTTFRYGFVEVMDDIGVYLVVGLLLAGIIAALLPTQLTQQYMGEGFLPMLLMIVIGTPMYICSTGSVPFAASLLAKGMAPVAGLVFLIVGPATNVSGFLVISKAMGKKAALLYIASIICFSILIASAIHLGGWL
ncbi:MAG TPA: permease [Thermoplasmata archaeon]|nr:permease [Thermoplasmata archaeon]